MGHRWRRQQQLLVRLLGWRYWVREGVRGMQQGQCREWCSKLVGQWRQMLLRRQGLCCTQEAGIRRVGRGGYQVWMRRCVRGLLWHSRAGQQRRLQLLPLSM